MFTYAELLTIWDGLNLLPKDAVIQHGSEKVSVKDLQQKVVSAADGNQSNIHVCPVCGSDLDFWGGMAGCPNDDCDFERPMTPDELED